MVASWMASLNTRRMSVLGRGVVVSSPLYRVNSWVTVGALGSRVWMVIFFTVAEKLPAVSLAT